MSKPSKKKKPSKEDLIADAMVESICDKYRSYREDPDHSGKVLEGHIPLSESVSKKKRDKLRLMIIKRLMDRKFSLRTIVISKRDGSDAVTFIVARNSGD